MKILTHDGMPHIDEITAIALLNRLELPLQVTRSRVANPNDFDMVLDVGSKYDGIKLFDHHQTDYTGNRSSAGLILDYIQTTLGAFTDLELARVKPLIDAIDAHDTGRAIMPLTSVNNSVASLINILNTEPKDTEERFLESVQIMTSYINSLCLNSTGQFVIPENILQSTEVTSLARLLTSVPTDIANITMSMFQKSLDSIASKQVEIDEIVRKALAKNSDVILIPKDSIFVPAKHFAGTHINLVVQWDKEQSLWSIQATNIAPNSFKLNCKIISAENAVFVHKNGFIAKLRELGKVITSNGFYDLSDLV